MDSGTLPRAVGDLRSGRPTNRFLIRQRDRRWPRALSAVLIVAGLLLALLFLVGWPRLRCTLTHYELVRLRAEVQDLGRREHALFVELERERSPRRLAERAAALGLAPPPAPQIATPGRLAGSP